MPVALLPSSTPLNQRIDSAIQTSPFLRGRKLQVESSEGNVILRGVVSSYYQKQMAQEALRQVDGVDRIDNRLEVSWH